VQDDRLSPTRILAYFWFQVLYIDGEKQASLSAVNHQFLPEYHRFLDNTLPKIVKSQDGVPPLLNHHGHDYFSPYRRMMELIRLVKSHISFKIVIGNKSYDSDDLTKIIIEAIATHLSPMAIPDEHNNGIVPFYILPNLAGLVSVRDWNNSIARREWVYERNVSYMTLVLFHNWPVMRDGVDENVEDFIELISWAVSAGVMIRYEQN